MLTVAFGESAKSGTQVQLWYNQFKKGREDVNDDDPLVARAGQQPMKTLDFESLLERLLMMLAYLSAQANLRQRRLFQNC